MSHDDASPDHAPDDHARAELRITGRVQGVFYRATTRDKAQQLGLNGWIQNMTDGSVRAVVEGRRQAIEALVDWAEQGPPKAEVDRVVVDWQDATGEHESFEIRRG